MSHFEGAEKFARLYVEHICLQLRYKPPRLDLRTFIDNWFAYKAAGPFLNSKLVPKWFNKPDPTKEAEALSKMHFMSEAARETIGKYNNTEVHLIKDHAVPVRIIAGKLATLIDPSVEAVENVLMKNYRLGVITKAEDGKLNRAGLRSNMPEGAWADAVFARYDAAGIVGSVNDQAIDALLR